MSTIKLIHGPISLTEHYSEKYDKHIYIFGDLHVNQLSPCSLDDTTPSMHIIDFILNYTRWNYKTNGLKTHLFLEAFKPKEDCEGPYMCDLEASHSDNYLSATIDFFKNFLRKTKSNIKEKYGIKDMIRVHYGDIRTFISGSKVIEAVPSLESMIRSGSKLFNILRYIHSNPIRSNIDIKTFIDVLDKAKTQLVDCSEFVQKSIEEYINHVEKGGIDEEILKTYNHYHDIADILDKQKTEKFKLVHQQSIDINNLILKIEKSIDEIQTYANVHLQLRKPYITIHEYMTSMYKSIIQDLSEFVEELNGYYRIMEIDQFMDEYLLARLFRTKIKVALIFVGDWHADTYRNFLKNVGFETVNEAYCRNYSNDYTKDSNTDLSVQCINVERFNFQIEPNSYCEWNGDEKDDMMYFYSYKLDERICMPRETFNKLQPENGFVNLGMYDFMITEDLHRQIKMEDGNNKFIYLAKDKAYEPFYSYYLPYIDFQTAQRNKERSAKTSPIYGRDTNNSPRRAKSP